MSPGQPTHLFAPLLPLGSVTVGVLLGVVLFFTAWPALTWPWALGLFGLALLGLVVARPTRLLWLYLGFLLVGVTLGLTAASSRTERLATAFLPLEYHGQRWWVTGTAVEVQPGREHTRLFLENVLLYPGGQTPVALPHKVRLSARAAAVMGLQTGDAVAAEAFLESPRLERFPGDFNYRHWAFYNQLSATGHVRGDIYVTPPAAYTEKRLQRWREGLAQGLYNSLGQTQGAAVLVALTTGLRTFIDPDLAEAYRDSGLAHLMAISGMNLAAVGGLIYVVWRFLWACWPWLALRVNGRKPAAVAGLVMAGFYMLLAGAEIPTVRAFVMVGFLFIAVLVERTRVALRLLLLAALGLALWWPEGVLTASFQMSFAAALSLILWAHWREGGWQSELHVMRGLGYVQAVWGTSLVAGLATLPLAVLHFQSFSIVGFVANLVGVPLMGLLTTPLALAGYALTPWVGLVALMPAAETLTWLNSLALHTAQWQGAGLYLPHGFGWVALVGLWGALLLIYWRRQRWGLGLAVVVLLGLWQVTRVDWSPAVVSLHGGQVLLLKRASGQADILWAAEKNDQQRRLIRDFARYQGWQVQPWTPALEGPDVACDTGGNCVLVREGRRILVAPESHLISAEDCAQVEVVLARLPIEACPQQWQPGPGYQAIKALRAAGS